MQSETIGKLAEALAKAQSEMKNAPFDQVNPHFKNKFASLAAVRDTVMPALSANGLALVQYTAIKDDSEQRQLILYTRLIHSSGEYVTSEWPLPYTPAQPQQLGSALTYGRRYGLSALLSIASEADDDGEGGAQHKPLNKTESALTMSTAKEDHAADFPGDKPPAPSKQAVKFADGFRLCGSLRELQDVMAATKEQISALHTVDRAYLRKVCEDLQAALR